MNADKLASFIERKMKDIEPGLSAQDKVRWLWGYHDALEDILNKVNKEDNE